MADCQHEETELRKRPTASGSQFAHQCVQCGALVGQWVKKPDHAVPAWDMDAEQAYRYGDYGAKREAFRQRQDDANARWWRTYQTFMESPVWKAMRQRVMVRAGGMCEACLEKPAQQVHHTVYPKGATGDGVPTLQELAAHPLYELRAICYECHALQHPHMRAAA